MKKRTNKNPTIFEKIVNKLREYDAYGQPVTLNFKGNETY